MPSNALNKIVYGKANLLKSGDVPSVSSGIAKLRSVNQTDARTSRLTGHEELTVHPRSTVYSTFRSIW